LVFADIRSPGTIANLRVNPVLEINVLDPIVRKGYRFRGTAEILIEGQLFEDILAFYRHHGASSRIRAIVLVKVECASPLISPAYDLGLTEAEVRCRWDQYWASIKQAGLMNQPLNEAA
jgi:hypothetical protein